MTQKTELKTADILNRLKEEMRARKIKHRFVCNKLEWTESRLSNKLNEKSPMTLPNLLQICQVVEIHPAALFPGFSFINTLDKLSIIDIFRQLIDEQIKKEFESKKIVSRVEY